MKVFISWSGKISRQVAESFRELLPYMFERIEPFASFEDIKKGEKGIQKILQELENTKFGIICLTPESVNSPWLNFEAGALAKTNDSQICTFLFGITRKELDASPLRDFQSTSYDKDDLRKLIQDMNHNYDSPLTETMLNNKFEDFWSKLTEKLNPISESLKQEVVFILEEKGLNVTQEKNNLQSTFSNLAIKTYPVEEIATLSNCPNLIIYIYSQSSQSQQKLEQTINYVQSQPQSPPLIIYTLDNKKLNDDEFAKAKIYKLANFPDTLIERCKEIL